MAMLATSHLGPETGTPLLIAHGLFGSARNWGVISKRLSSDRPVLTVDMRNHGESPWFDTQGYGEMASDLAEVIAANGGTADILGHSMGGKASMRLALEHPELVRKLVVADIAPVAYTHTQMHLVEAMKRLDVADLASRSEADTRLSTDIDTPAVRAFLLQSLDLKSDPPRWRLNLDVLGAEMDRITGWEDVAGEFARPVLFLSGAESDYVRPEHRDKIVKLFPNAKFVKIPEAGHWLHAEKPREVEAAVAAFLAET